MGVSLCASVGYYIVAKAKSYESEKFMGRKCKNGHGGDGKFCSQCGELLESQYKNVTEYREFFDADVENDVTIFGETYVIEDLIREIDQNKKIKILQFNDTIKGVSVSVPDPNYFDEYTHNFEEDGGALELDDFKPLVEVEQELRNSGLSDVFDEIYEKVEIKFGILSQYL